MSGTVYGFRFAATEDDQYYLRQLFASAMEHRAPVRVSYFKEKKIETADGKGKPALDAYGNRIFVKVTRVVEPFEFATTKAGARLVRVVDRTPEGERGPEYRSIRLDRVAVRYSDGKPLATRMMSHGYLCPSLLDFKPLHSTKRILTAA